jgi:ketosteroid isomerase-like protein
MNMDYKEKLENYFKAFSNKDVDALSKMLSNDVTLIDWENNASGKTDVLEVNKKIFDSSPQISVTPIQYYESDKSYAIKIEVEISDPNDSDSVIEDEFVMSVLDIISFDDDGLIKSVEAYLR